MKQKALEKRDKRPGQRGPAAIYGIEAIDWAEVGVTLCMVARRGGALRIGLTRDGGALSIGVYGIGEPYTLYVRPSDSVKDILTELEEGFRAEYG
jgi:hypothetical protein